jgi:hypothetical protein
MQVLLAQLRTHLSLVRTGAGMFVGSLTVMFLLLANAPVLPPFFARALTLIFGLLSLSMVLGVVIFIRSEAKIIAVGRLIKEAEKQSKEIDRIMV